MSLNKEFLSRETNITAKVICDSINEQGVRLTTFEIEYPRFILAELNTHRQLSKNSSSSRAIPINKMLSQIEDNIAMPVYWGKAKSGMQADGEVQQDACITSQMWWESSFKEQKCFVNRLSDLGLHKQVPNRLIEPFQMMKTVITGTDWSNFFNLRLHPDAQPEICMLAYKMYKAMEESKPITLSVGEWHLPYVNLGWCGKGELCYADDGFDFITLEQAIKLSAASCASVSYRTEGMTLEKADKIFDMLIKAEVVHSSPFEHLATPVKPKSNELGLIRVNCSEPQSWEDGITHVNKQGELCSGNLRGWIQYRHLLPNNTCWKFDYNERIKMFK